jgi:hypothetical protein
MYAAQRTTKDGRSHFSWSVGTVILCQGSEIRSKGHSVQVMSAQPLLCTTMCSVSEAMAAEDEYSHKAKGWSEPAGALMVVLKTQH